MMYIRLVLLSVASIYLNQVHCAIDATFLKQYQDKVCQNQPTCNLTLTPSIPANRLTFDGRDCMCDFECAEYNDCCPDSEYLNTQTSSNKKYSYVCHPTFKFYTVFGCPASYQDENVKRKCEKALQPLDEDDTFIILPVTNKEKRRTYANVYCALCNDDTNVDLWTLGSGCGVPNAPPKKGVDFSKYNHKLNQILPNAHYNSTAKKFLAYYEGKELTCEFSAKQPSNFAGYVRKCLPNLVAECSAEPDGAKKCQSYISVVYDSTNKTPYRNRECAICNGVPADKLTGCPLAVRTGASSLFSSGTKSAGSDACSNPIIAQKFC